MRAVVVRAAETVAERAAVSRAVVARVAETVGVTVAGTVAAARALAV